jgi:hypothetical protein
MIVIECGGSGDSWNRHMKVDEDAQGLVGCGIFFVLVALAFAIVAYAWRVIL